MRRIILILGIFMLCGFAHGQVLEIELSATQITLQPAENGRVALVVENNFRQIAVGSFSLKFDPTVVSFKGVDFTNIYANTEVNESEIAMGHIGISFSSLISPGPSLDFEDTLLWLNFQAIGFNGDYSDILLHDSPVDNFVDAGTFGDPPQFVINSGKVSIGTSNSIEEKQLLNQISIYPNPASDFASVRFEDFKGESILMEIIDMSGRVCESRTLASATSRIDLSNYTEGIYFMSLQSANQKRMVRLVIK